MEKLVVDQEEADKVIKMKKKKKIECHLCGMEISITNKHITIYF
jgi:redox-regulated HSP33 family molecular chaperone